MSAVAFTVVDIETTGLAPPAEIIEIGWQDVHLSDGETWLGMSGGCLFGAANGIPPETMAVHHITASMVAGLCRCVGRDLAEMLQGSRGGAPADVLVAHNSAFEQAFLQAHGDHGPWICTYKAALRVWPEAPGHSNSVLRYWLDLDCDPARAMPPHRAQPDAYVTAKLFERLLSHATVEEMLAWTREPRLLPCCPLGKFRGQPWPKVEQGFLQWMLRTPDMDPDLVWNARREISRREKALA